MQDDPVELIREIISENAQSSPIDFVAFAGEVAKGVNGMPGAARIFVNALRKAKTEANKVSMVNRMADLFLKAEEQQKARRTATDLTTEQLNAVLGFLTKLKEQRGSSDEQSERDAFGSPDG